MIPKSREGIFVKYFPIILIFVEEVHWKVRNLSTLFPKSVKGVISIKKSLISQVMYGTYDELPNILKNLYEPNGREELYNFFALTFS